MSEHRMSDREKAYLTCAYGLPIFAPLLLVLIATDLWRLAGLVWRRIAR